MSSCSYAHLDGSYVLGALSPAERQEYERHLDDCPACARAVQELAGLPGLLGKTDLAALESPEAEVPLPDTLLPTLVHEVRRQQRRRLLATGAVAAAAAAVLTVGSLTVLGGAGDPAPQAVPAPSVSAAPSGEEMVPVGYGRMAANVALASVPWGTRLDLACSYAPAGPGDDGAAASYALFVQTRDGRSEQVATWRALPGRTMTLTAATSATRDQIRSVEVRTADGQPVLKLTT
jgi:hypothetical protein